MKISHESPISMLQTSRQYNDYEYCLVHLMDNELKYRDFFFESKEQGRKVLLDNSIFELGTAFDSEKYAVWIDRLRPDEYIIPDVLEDTVGTMDNAVTFTNTYKDLPGKKIGVVQGKSYMELTQCYRYLDRYVDVDKIAISFDYSYYLSVSNHPNKWMAYTLGRIQVLNRLAQDGIINTNKPHHLLGCALPIEFMFYNYPWIETIDTSSPIVHGLLGIEYNNYGLTEKQSIKLVDLLHAQPTYSQMVKINKNLEIFRSFVDKK